MWTIRSRSARTVGLGAARPAGRRQRSDPHMPARRALLLVAALLAGPGCADAQSVLVADGRVAASAPVSPDWDTHPAVQAARAAAATYWAAREPGFEEDFVVLAVAEGSFTTPGRDQHAVLYAMSLWPRCCPKMGVAFVEESGLAANVAFELIAQQLSAVPDLDQDDRAELALVGAFGMGGEESTLLTVATFAPGQLVSIGTATIHESTCAALPEGGTTSAARVMALPGPEFQVERYRGSCEAESWELVSEALPLELAAPPENPFVDLGATVR